METDDPRCVKLAITTKNGLIEEIRLPKVLLQYFITLETMISDFGDDELLKFAIPLHNVDRKDMVIWVIRFYIFYHKTPDKSVFPVDWWYKLGTYSLTDLCTLANFLNYMDSRPLLAFVAQKIAKTLLTMAYKDTESRIMSISKSVPRNYTALVRLIRETLGASGLSDDARKVVLDYIPGQWYRDKKDTRRPLLHPIIRQTGRYTLLMTTNGVYSWGYSKHGATGSSYISSSPSKMISNRSVVDTCFATQGTVTLVATTKGVYACGNIEKYPIVPLPSMAKPLSRVSYMRIPYTFDVVSQESDSLLIVVCVATNGDAGFIATNRGLYGQGEIRQLGIGSDSREETKQLVRIPLAGDPTHIYSVVCNDVGTTFAWTDKGIYQWGHKKTMAFEERALYDASDKYVTTPIKLVLPGDPEIYAIYSGDGRTMIVTADGVYAFGFNNHYSLGIGSLSVNNDNDGIANIPKKVPIEGVSPNDIRVIMCCQNDRTFIVTNDGRVYHAGDEIEFLEVPASKYFIKLEATLFPPSGVYAISCENYRATVVTLDGQVYVIGKNNRGQLGLIDKAYRTEWTLLPTIKCDVEQVEEPIVDNEGDDDNWITNEDDEEGRSTKKQRRDSHLFSCKMCGNTKLSQLQREASVSLSTRFVFCDTRCQDRFYQFQFSSDCKFV